MPQYRRGFGRQLAKTLYVEIIDNPAGDLTLRQRSTTQLAIKEGYNVSYYDLRLGTGKVLEDVLGNTLLDPDDAGNIATLAPVTGAVTLSGGVAGGSGDSEVTVHGRNAVAPSSDGIATTSGEVEFTANGTLEIKLDSLIPVKLLGGTVKITTIVLGINTDNNGAYINSSTIYRKLVDGGTFTSLHSDPDDTGNGSTGEDTRTITLNHTRNAGEGLYLYCGIAVSAGSLFFNGITINYEIV